MHVNGVLQQAYNFRLNNPLILYYCHISDEIKEQNIPGQAAAASAGVVNELESQEGKKSIISFSIKISKYGLVECSKTYY